MKIPDDIVPDWLIGLVKVIITLIIVIVQMSGNQVLYAKSSYNFLSVRHKILRFFSLRTSVKESKLH